MIDLQSVWENNLASSITGLLVALLLVRRTRSWATRWRLHNQIEGYYKGQYALSKDDEKNGLPRMSKCGYKGVHDAQTILRQTQFKEMPFLFHKSLEFALFRTYAIPSISKILLRTGNLADIDKSTRRYADTVILITSFAFYPLPRLDLEEEGGSDEKQPTIDPPPWLHDEDHMFDKEDPRSAVALARTNWLHRRANKIHGPKGAPISNDDLLYTLSVFVTQPIEWLGRFGWRAMTPLEKEASFTVWEHIGKCMGIEGIPDTLDQLFEWAEDYEQKYMVFEPQNKEVAWYTVILLLWHIPTFIRPLFFPLVTSLLDERLRLAIGFEPAPALIKWIPKAALLTWAYSHRWFRLPRHHYGVRVPYYGDEKEGLMEAMCPASGKTTANGAKCPVNGDTPPEAKPRMVPRWTDNEPHYMGPLPALSLRGIYERLFVPYDKRWGTKRWQSVRTKDESANSIYGYRLEECGPKGLEQQGRDEIRDEAEKMTGSTLSGQWAI